MAALAGRVPLPALRWASWVAVEQRSLGVFGLRAAGFGHGRDDLPPHSAPLRLWFGAAWEMTSQKQGVSALGIQRSLGLGSYQTAWAMLHRYRKAMVCPGCERLAGWVEVDEAYLGGVEGGVFGRQTDTKAIVAIAVEIENPRVSGGFDCNASTMSPRTA